MAAELTEADRFLLEQIRRGDPDGWEQLVQRYQGRLLAFARSRIGKNTAGGASTDPDDLVQETFIQFFRGLGEFRGDASVETYLFTILRRRLVDQFRGRKLRVCSLQETLDDDSDSGGSSGLARQIAGRDLTASTYARRDEREELERSALIAALSDLIEHFKSSRELRDLQVVEMLFYGRLRNKDIGQILQMDEKQVALIKHRSLKQIHQSIQQDPRLRRYGTDVVGSGPAAWEESAEAASMLSEIWEEQRLTCPKRSTIGRYMLGTLEAPWRQYVDFHLNRLGCQFCRANLEDLQKQTPEQRITLSDRILHSTIGFFRKP